ncbi:helix-turn-helix domain-containing protein [Bradyrhizobium roseum]|uniref:helix-turn-helix domain-containing protein n=1 Tax=Bradyrhizobium roseum TaxID=3056648 RepID=UPI00260B3B31|nr:helix-turn-helix transcriptional regulator [Bradyrhizobium roseus]WKA29886.1 helix-turn-helix transcriptional regulator [Bradyrhizobium roseus]
MATMKSGALDQMVGARIRMLRVHSGITQTALAARIGVTFQQVAKYEQGDGRVGASMLARIASLLDVSVGEFFEFSRPGLPVSRLSVFPHAEPRARQVPKTYPRMANPQLRARIVELAETVVDQGAATKSADAPLNTVDLSKRRKFPSRG